MGTLSAQRLGRPRIGCLTSRRGRVWLAAVGLLAAAAGRSGAQQNQIFDPNHIPPDSAGRRYVVTGRTVWGPNVAQAGAIGRRVSTWFYAGGVQGAFGSFPGDSVRAWAAAAESLLAVLGTRAESSFVRRESPPLTGDSSRLTLSVNVTAGSAQFYYDLRGTRGERLAAAPIPSSSVREFLQAVGSAGKLAAAAPAPRAVESFEMDPKRDKTVRMVPGGVTAEYPAELRRAGIPGYVLMSYIVGPDGRVERGSEQPIAYSRGEFLEAVRAALPGMRYLPAEYRGRKVRMVVQQPFYFAPGS
jgi:hypothetical protein